MTQLLNQSVAAPEIAAKSSSVHFYFLDALRGLAALWVVFYHVGDDRMPHLLKVIPNWILTPVFHWGSLGVAIFFVLSGFVIAHSLRKAQIDWPYFKNFTLRRLVRLSPPYYASIVFCLGLGIVAAIAKGEAWPFPSPLQLAAHALYVQDLLKLGHINDAYWTLCLELQFYLSLCGLLFLTQRWGAKATAQPAAAPAAGQPAAIGPFSLMGLAAAVSLIWPLFIEQTSRPTYFLPHWHGFLLGVFAYWAWTQRLRAVYFYSYAAILIVGAIVHQQIFTIACVLAAVALLLAGQYQRMGMLSHGSLQFLGKISYSLYLVHTPVLGAVFFLGFKVLGTTGLTELALIGAGVVASGAIAIALWWLVEQPSITWSQKLKQSS